MFWGVLIFMRGKEREKIHQGKKGPEFSRTGLLYDFTGFRKPKIFQQQSEGIGNTEKNTKGHGGWNKVLSKRGFSLSVFLDETLRKLSSMLIAISAFFIQGRGFNFDRSAVFDFSIAFLLFLFAFHALIAVHIEE